MLQDLIAQAKQLRREHERDLLGLLDRIQSVDPDLVQRTLHTITDRSKAARWLTTPHQQLSGLSPLEAAARGHKDDVIAILGRIDQGVFA